MSELNNQAIEPSLALRCSAPVAEESAERKTVEDMDMTERMHFGRLAMDSLRNIVELCEGHDTLDWLEERLKDLTSEVGTKAAARKIARGMEHASLEERVQTIRGWLVAHFKDMEREAIATGNTRVRTQVRRRLDDDISYGVTLNRRNGEQIYYVANIYLPRDVKAHRIEGGDHPNSSYCGMDIGIACDRLARRILGEALRLKMADEALYIWVQGSRRH